MDMKGEYRIPLPQDAQRIRRLQPRERVGDGHLRTVVDDHHLEVSRGLLAQLQQQPAQERRLMIRIRPKNSSTVSVDIGGWSSRGEKEFAREFKSLFAGLR